MIQSVSSEVFYLFNNNYRKIHLIAIMKCLDKTVEYANCITKTQLIEGPGYDIKLHQIVRLHSLNLENEKYSSITIILYSVST